MDDCNCDDYLVHDNGYWVTCGNGYAGYFQEWFNFSGPRTILWPVLAVDSSDNCIPFSYEINVTSEVSDKTWTNTRNCSYTGGNSIHIRSEIEDPAYSANTEFFYLNGNEWISSTVTNIFDDTYESVAPIDPYNTFYCRYKSQPASNPITMMSAYLPNDNFPPNLSELAFIDNDPTGDNVGGTGTNMDITEEYFGFSNNRIFGVMKNNGGGYPTNDGFPYDDYFIYAIGFNNPASAYSNSIYYALVYCDIPFYNDYGLYRIIDDDFTDIGDISYDVNGDYLKMAGNFSDLISDPYFGPWNNDGNDILQLQSYTILAEDYGANIIYADETDYSIQLIDNYEIPSFSNIHPDILDHNYTQNGYSTTFTTIYSDANSHFPIVAELDLTDPRTGMREIYQLEPTSLDYSVPIVFTTNVNCHTWANGLFRFSDNGYQYVTQSISGQTTLIAADFESGTSNWNLENSWNLTDSDYHSYNHSLTDSSTRNYTDNRNDSVTLNPLSFSGYAEIDLYFWEKHDLETSWDYVYLEISTGSGWTILDTFNGLNSPWTEKTYSLNSYIGYSNVQIRFRIQTDGSATFDGFYVDDFDINASGTSSFGTISGTVTEEDGVTPVAGATVTASQHSTTTNGNGSYTLESLASGTYDVICGDADHYSKTTVNQQVNEGETIIVNFSLELVLSVDNQAYLNFDGSGDYLNCGNDNSVDITDEITIEALIRLVNANNDQKVVGKTQVGNGYVLGV